MRARLILALMLIAPWPTLRGGAASDPISLDVPAMVPAARSDSGADQNLAEITIEIPVSLLARDANLELEELLVAVYWASEPQLVSHFAPDTQLVSDIEGPIQIQETRSRNLSMGVKGQGDYAGTVGLKADAGMGTSSSTTTSFSKKPELSLLATRGIIKRGTGIYFKFRPSTQTTLEGTQLLLVQFRVPRSWQAGLLRVDCLVQANRPGFTSFDSKRVEFMNEFEAAVYLQGNEVAYDMAREYARQALGQQAKRRDSGKFSKSKTLSATMIGDDPGNATPSGDPVPSGNPRFSGNPKFSGDTRSGSFRGWRIQLPKQLTAFKESLLPPELSRN